MTVISSILKRHEYYYVSVVVGQCDVLFFLPVMRPATFIAKCFFTTLMNGFVFHLFLGVPCGCSIPQSLSFPPHQTHILYGFLYFSSSATETVLNCSITSLPTILQILFANSVGSFANLFMFQSKLIVVAIATVSLSLADKC